MKISQLRAILKDGSRENFQRRIKALDDPRSRQVNDSLMAAQFRLKKYLNSSLYRSKIKKFANWHSYTDVYAYEVVRVVSAKCVEVRELVAEQIEFPQVQEPGGFMAVMVDNHNQKYRFKSDPMLPVFKIRFTKSGYWKAGSRKFMMADKPYKFHDYNF